MTDVSAGGICSSKDSGASFNTTRSGVQRLGTDIAHGLFKTDEYRA
jgi:hypothetical protein